ncbi:hypothetical protein B566_EDAN014699 [Ephemera danica]|nr:hypothetical protein B566_EDAN014699 [Ephemera danica]
MYCVHQTSTSAAAVTGRTKGVVRFRASAVGCSPSVARSVSSVAQADSTGLRCRACSCCHAACPMQNTRLPASSSSTSAHSKPKSLQQATSDPLAACLDANGTYICTAYNPRCFIIQKVTPGGLNPHADTFEHKHHAAVAAAAVAAADAGASLEPWGAIAATAASTHVEQPSTLATLAAAEGKLESLITLSFHRPPPPN